MEKEGVYYQQNQESADDTKESDRVTVALGMLKGGETILDIGCNTGWFLDRCNHLRKFGVDIDEKFVNVTNAKGYFAERNFSWDLQLEDDKFDRVHFGQTLAHMRKDLGIRSMKEVYRVLKPKGIAVISTKAGPNFRAGFMLGQGNSDLKFFSMPVYHVHEWEPPELYQEIKNIGFKVLESCLVHSNVDNPTHISIVMKLTKD